VKENFIAPPPKVAGVKKVEIELQEMAEGAGQRACLLLFTFLLSESDTFDSGKKKGLRSPPDVSASDVPIKNVSRIHHSPSASHFSGDRKRCDAVKEAHGRMHGRGKKEKWLAGKSNT